jgi:uncharacterized membrane protein YbhN (UPF0104 family)
MVSDARRRGMLERLGAAGADLTSLEPTNPRVRRALRIGLIVLVLAFLVAAITSQWHKLPEIDWRFSPGWLAVALVCFLAFQASHAELWGLMLRALGHGIDMRRARSTWNVSLLGRYVPTSALMAVGRAALAEREGVPKRVTLASILYEIALTFGTAMTVGAYFVITLPQTQGHASRWLALAVPIVALVFLHPAVFHRAADYVFRRLGREPLPFSLSLRHVALFALGYGAGFVIVGIGVYALAQTIHPISSSDLPTAVGAYAIGYAAAIAGFLLPGGLGARETGMAIALSPAMPLAVGIAVAVSVRLIQMGIELLYAVVTPAIARRRGSAPAPS